MPPLREAFFVRKISVRKVIIIDNQWKWSIVVTDWCCMCRKSEESANHFLLHFEIAIASWNDFLGGIRLVWVFPRRIATSLLVGGLCGYPQQPCGRWVPNCLMYCIWREMNNIDFENHKQNELKIFFFKCCSFGSCYRFFFFFPNVLSDDDDESADQK